MYVEGRAVDGIDLFGLKKKLVELYDDFGNKCCSDEMKLIVKYTLRPFTKNHQVGHSFIYCPTIGYRGKYPAGNPVISNGEIRDDESLYKQYKQTDRLVIEASYKACPTSYKKMAKFIKEESENPGKYILSGAQCEDWVNYVIESSKTSEERKQDPRINVKKSALQMPGTPDLDIKDVEETERQSFFILRYGFKF